MRSSSALQSTIRKSHSRIKISRSKNLFQKSMLVLQRSSCLNKVLLKRMQAWHRNQWVSRVIMRRRVRGLLGINSFLSTMECLKQSKPSNYKVKDSLKVSNSSSRWPQLIQKLNKMSMLIDWETYAKQGRIAVIAFFKFLQNLSMKTNKKTWNQRGSNQCHNRCRWTLLSNSRKDLKLLPTLISR